MTEPRFKKRALVVHVKTNTLYRILHTPKRAKIEATGEPCYVYVKHVSDDQGAPIWVRSQTEMEDGRFVDPLDWGDR